MKPNRVLATLLLLIACSGSAHAQNGCARLGWNLCDPWVENSNFTGSGVYTLVESMFGISAPNVGSDTQIRIGVGFGVPDAWRFDDSGCQAGRLSTNNSAFSKSCPAMKGTNPHSSTQFTIDGGDAVLRLTTSYDAFAPAATTRYTVWQILFDHSHSSVGPTPPDHSSCGGAELCEDLSFDFARIITPTGQAIALPPCDVDRYEPCSSATWNGGCAIDVPPDGLDCSKPVPALPATWGKLKSLYR